MREVQGEARSRTPGRNPAATRKQNSSFCGAAPHCPKMNRNSCQELSWVSLHEIVQREPIEPFILEVSKRTLICAKKSRFFSKFHQFLVEVLDRAHHSDVRRQSWTCCYQWYHTAAALWGGCHALKCQTTQPLCCLWQHNLHSACRARHRLAPHVQLSFLLVQNASILEQKYDVPCFCFSTLLKKLLRGGQ